jgi:HEAT repeat protein
MYRAFAFTALLVGIATFLTAQEPAPGKSIAQLIEDLGNQDFNVREAAAKAIEALGPEALPALRKAKDHPELEVRRRIKEWIPKFEMGAAACPTCLLSRSVQS